MAPKRKSVIEEYRTLFVEVQTSWLGRPAREAAVDQCYDAARRAQEEQAARGNAIASLFAFCEANSTGTAKAALKGDPGARGSLGTSGGGIDWDALDVARIVRHCYAHGGQGALSVLDPPYQARIQSLLAAGVRYSVEIDGDHLRLHGNVVFDLGSALLRYLECPAHT
jgi:hypothetical protein